MKNEVIAGLIGMILLSAFLLGLAQVDQQDAILGYRAAGVDRRMDSVVSGYGEKPGGGIIAAA